MEDLNDKVTGDTTPLTAAQWNQIPKEIQNVITSSGQTLTSADLFQLTKAVAHYVASGSFYIDSGTANSYVLNEIDSNAPPPAYVNGMEAEFVVSNTNTGASTVVVDGLSSVNITNTGTAGTLTIGDIVRLRYNSGSGEFEIAGKKQFGNRLRTGDYLASTATDILDRPYLLADGSDVSRTTYAKLFAKIGTSFGVGDGSTTFGLPDLSDQPLVPAITTNTASWVDQSIGSTPNDLVDMEIDQFNNDVWVISGGATDDVFKSAGGTAAFAAAGNFNPLDSQPQCIAVNSANGDVWVGGLNTSSIYRSIRGIEDFQIVGNYSAVGDTPTGISVNTSNGDVWIADNGFNPCKVFVLKGGLASNSYVEASNYTASFLRDIAVNSANGDVWAVEDDEVFKSQGGVTNFQSVGSYGGSQATSITVDPTNGNVWVIDSPVGVDTLYLLEGGTGTFSAVGTYPDNTGVGIDVDHSNGDLWIADNTVSVGAIYKADGSIDTEAAKWYIHNGIV